MNIRTILKDRHYLRFLLLAILLRVIIMPFYFHPDIKTYHFQSSFLKKGVFNIYTYLEDNKDKLPLKEEFVYFPLSYLTLGGYQVVISPILGEGFDDWLADASGQGIKAVGTFRYLFFLKLPYLFLDILIAFLLMSFFSDIRRKKRVFLLWLFNPFSLIILYGFSNIDIIPVCFTLWSLLLARKKKYIQSGVALAVGAGFKAFPLLFLPFLVLKGRNTKERLLITISSLAVFGVIVAPFLSKSFMEASMVSGLTTRIISSGIEIGFGEIIMPSIVLMAVLFFYLWGKKGNFKLYQSYIALTLILYSTIHFHIQWLLWAMPLLVLLVVKKKRHLFITITLLVIALAIPFLYQDKFMSVALLTPISSLYGLVPAPFAIVQKVFSPLSLQGILHSGLLGASLVVIYRMFKKEKA